MMSSIEGLAPNQTALGADVSQLKDSYRRLLTAIDRGELEVARHLMNVIDAQQSGSKGLSDGAQAAFDRLAIAAATEDTASVRAALQAFRGALRSSSSLPPSSAVCASVEPSGGGRVEDSRPSGVTPRFRFEDYDTEAFDQELPDTASLFPVDHSW